MNKFWNAVLEWKVAAGLLYLGTMLVYLICCAASKRTQVETSMLWTLLLVCAAGSLIQGLCFTDWVFQKLRYTWRLALFCLLFLPLLAVTAWAFQWFPMERESWMVFWGIFLVIFAAMTIGFEMYYRLTGRKYDGLLGQYRREKEKQEP